MHAGNLYEGCRQWPLWQALLARLEASPDGRGSMTSREGVHCLLEAGIETMDIRDEFGVVRKHAPEFGYELLPAEPVRGDGNSRAYRYTLRANVLPVGGDDGEIQPDAALREAAEPVGALAPAGAPTSGESCARAEAGCEAPAPRPKHQQPQPRPGQQVLFGGGRA